MNSGQKLQWLALVGKALPRDLTAYRVAGALMDRLNSRTGQLNPSHQTLASDCGVSESTAKRAIRGLLNAGLIEIANPGGRGRHSSNQYRLKGVTDEPLNQPLGGQQRTPKTAFRGSNGASLRGSPVTYESKKKNPPARAPLEAAPGVEVHDRLGPAVPSPEGLKARKAAMAELRRVLAPKDVPLECSK